MAEPVTVADARVIGADGRSELYVTDPVNAGVAPDPVFKNPSAVGFKKMTEFAGIALVLGNGKFAEKFPEYRALVVSDTPAKQPVNPAGHVPVSGYPTLKFVEV
jgi:hypothetical protein